MASAALSPRGAAGASHRQSTIVTRERVIAPPERFITASDEQLVAYFKGKQPAGQPACLRLQVKLCTAAISVCKYSIPFPSRCKLYSSDPPAAASNLPRNTQPPGHNPDVRRPLLGAPCCTADAFGAELAPAVPVLQQLVESICTHDFSALRRQEGTPGQECSSCCCTEQRACQGRHLKGREWPAGMGQEGCCVAGTPRGVIAPVVRCSCWGDSTSSNPHAYAPCRCRRLQSDYEYFGAAAEARSDVRLSERC